MGSVQIFKWVNGMPLEKVIAIHDDVQDELERQSTAGGARAEGHLRAHEYEGHSRISVERVPSELWYSDIDRMVVLDDTRGLKAAMSIEFGRKGGRAGSQVITRMRGIAPLRKAFGLEVD